MTNIRILKDVQQRKQIDDNDVKLLQTSNQPNSISVENKNCNCEYLGYDKISKSCYVVFFMTKMKFYNHGMCFKLDYMTLPILQFYFCNLIKPAL